MRNIPGSTGFTLIELMAVILVVSVGLAGLARMFGNSSLTLATAENIQVTAQYAQECAEYVLGVRRDLGIASVTTNTCSTLPALPSGYSRTLELASNTTGACPASSSCTNAAVTVNGPNTSTTITIMLIQ